MKSRLRFWNIAIGKFFFRYRNALFPLIFAVSALTLRPRIMFSNMAVDRLLVRGGVALALLGQAVRLTTIGFDYIHRGGKNGQVYAGRLVRGGIYALLRNPMYVGNALIAVGMTMQFGSPLAYLIVIPFFLFVYQAIVAAEEGYLREKFGAEYKEYESSVNRYLPALARFGEAFTGLRFDWRKSIQKDLGTVIGLIIGLILIPVWRAYFLYSCEATEFPAMRALLVSLGVGALYLFLLKLKRHDRLFKTGVSHPQKSPLSDQRDAVTCKFPP
jgi:protein-S-isoprenylcysteine O-methyltransferase Ste14